MPVRLRMSEEDVARFAVRRFEFPGVDIKTRQTRCYPNNELAVHALGYVAAISEQDLQRIDRAAYSGTTLIGKLGVESAYEPQLHGTNGFREVLVNAQGRSVRPAGRAHARPARQGAHCGPGPAAHPRHARRSAWPRKMLGGQARRGRRASTRRTATCIALVSRPGFDPNLFGRGLTRAEYAALNERHRPAAVQPRAARHLSVRLDDQAGHRARRPRHTTR